MKKYIHLIAIVGLFFFTVSCNEKNEGILSGDEKVDIERMYLALEGAELEIETKAVSDYAVNQGNDPTAALAGREDWLLDVTIYKGGTPYEDGSAVFTMGSNVNTWLPETTIYFPNYTRQRVALRMYPDGWTTIDPDQSATDGSGLLGQDILEQNGNTTVTLFPAHIPSADLRHANSMLDFKLSNVTAAEIGSVTVTIDNTEYQPYQVVTGNNPEYMLIVPVGTTAPVINVYTVGGARYTQTTVREITSTTVNNCYCFTLEGLELKLGEITIAEWTTGPSILGEYTTEESYPTFRGPPSLITQIYYDNGLDQVLIFNEQGETTERPVGRTIIKIQIERNIITLDTPLVLNGMVVDLTPYINESYWQ